MSTTTIVPSNHLVRRVIRGEVHCNGVRLYHPALELHHGAQARLMIDPDARRLRVCDDAGVLICELAAA